METKICSKCNIEKDICDFNKKKDTKDGYRNHCRECQKLTRNKQKDKEGYKKWASANKEHLRLKAKKYRLLKGITPRNINGLNKEPKIRIRLTPEEKKEKKRLYYKKRMEEPLFKLSKNIRRRILSSLKRKNLYKTTNTQIMIGCSFEDFKKHIESLWEDWMNWDNYGLYNGEPNYGWDIDHIKPTSIAKTEEEMIKLFHYTNTQPLCSYYNRVIKQDNITNLP